ncbi:(6-4)-photolyase [Brevipalpus obovatus]|uniref:(6-4)-photolyase n=1 Tax=Brevipalpus obovatus TaxID=246614 RepID=UPI003D9E3629
MIQESEKSVNETQNCEKTSEMTRKNLVHWFRKGLRLHDQPALSEGLQDCATFRCVYLIDPWFSCNTSCQGVNKWHFLLQSLEDLDKNLRILGSRLFVIRGQPAEVFPPLFKEWSITHMSFEEDPEPFGKIRDQKIARMCDEMGIQVISRTSHTLYKLDAILEKCGGNIPLTFSQFQKIVTKMDPPPEPEPAITQNSIPTAYTPLCMNHAKRYAVPSLEEIGFPDAKFNRSTWIGGETEALHLLTRYLEHKAWVLSFGEQHITARSLFAASHTSLSPYLRFGCLSARLLYHELSNLYRKLKNTEPPFSLHGQLMWREFFYLVATNNSNFDKMRNNPLCVQIAWNSDKEALSKWAHGQTGYPLIDAIQTQLRREGWIHQIARHVTACFLTRGILWISWEEGMKVFDELLIDADWSVNAGSWLWLSCSSFFQRISQIYCPVEFGRKIDPQGDYIRRYLPSLRNFPNEYLHEPWKAPKSVQQEAHCIIGKHYPLPIVDHREAMKINLERMRQVFRILIKDLNLKIEKEPSFPMDQNCDEKNAANCDQQRSTSDEP